jgi:hypothetical protein
MKIAQGKLTKHNIKIDKASRLIATCLTISVFILVGSFVGCYQLLKQAQYQNKVLKEKNASKTNLEVNIKNVNALNDSYASFVSSPINFIGGESSGEGPRDGNNAKLVLDAMPSKYDFPATISSIEKLISENGYKLESISGDENIPSSEKTEQSTTPTSTNDAVSGEISIDFVVYDSYERLVQLMSQLENSIRPIKVEKMIISGQNSNMRGSFSIKTYYQPKVQFIPKQRTIK